MDALKLKVRRFFRRAQLRPTPMEAEPGRPASTVIDAISAAPRPITPVAPPGPTSPALAPLRSNQSRFFHRVFTLQHFEPPMAPLPEPKMTPVTCAQLEVDVPQLEEALNNAEQACIAALAEYRLGPITHAQWWALIGLHKKLMNKHIALFEKVFHPSGSVGLHALATSRRLAARMCDHGVRGLLTLQARRLPRAREYMNAFADMAFLNIALMHENHPMFALTWTQCLGEIARASQFSADEDDPRDWAAIAQYWYGKAVDLDPQSGRLQYDLGSVMPRQSFEQLGQLTKAATVKTPSEASRVLLRNIVQPILSAPPSLQRRNFHAHFLTAIGQVLTHSRTRITQDTVTSFLLNLDGYIDQAGATLRQHGVSIATAQAAVLLDFKPTNNFFTQRHAISADATAFVDARQFAMGTLEIASIRAHRDPNVLPYIHASLAFLDATWQSPTAQRALATAVPCDALRGLTEALMQDPRVRRRLTTRGAFAFERPLRDDFEMRGLSWTQDYFPKGHFAEKYVQDEARSMDFGKSIDLARKIRIAGLAYRVLRAYSA